jgi:serine/threonine protein kinase
VLRGDWAMDAAARDRFAAEAAVAKRVPPFCAARVLDAGLDGSNAYLVSEYIVGPSLMELVATDGVRRGHDLEAMAIGMATGLASVHQAGLVHGNFGPEFVIIAPDGSPRVVEYAITPPYGAATPSADMFAWAQTVVFAASGRPPATYDDLDVLPDHLRGVVQQCLDPGAAGRLSARGAVQSLLGSQDLPAGLLAEGSRRARLHRVGYDSVHGSPSQPGQADAWPLAARATATRTAGTRASASHAASARTQDRRSVEGRPGSRHSAGSLPVRHARGGTQRGRRGIWLTGGAVAAIVVVAVSLYVLLGGGHPSSGLLSASAGRTSSSPPPTAAATPSQGPATPGAFNGSWSGVVTQPPTDTYHVRVTLAGGTTAGTISYSGSGFRCSGALTLTNASPRKLVMSQGIINGRSKCGNGQVTISLRGANRIWFSFHSSGPIASGSLARSSR